jgi:methanogenic corrinoid protein MtbC1
MTDKHTINDVSRISGVPKDLLRMWERRYGYPKPARDVNGARIYSSEQLNKLVLIRQLMGQGKRPGKLMMLDLPDLTSLVKEEPKVELNIDQLFDLLKARDAENLREWFQNQVQAHGLRSFIHKVMAPATRAVGEAWSRGDLAIHEEHLYTELMKNLVRQSLTEHDQEGGVGPRIMLTTVPGERHSLGLLMVETLLRLGGAEVIAFGVEMPFRDIKDAAVSHKVDVIGLSFSASFKSDDAIVMLTGLRQMIDPGIRIWVGGAAFDGGASMPEGVELLDGLHGVEKILVKSNRAMSGNS